MKGVCTLITAASIMSEKSFVYRNFDRNFASKSNLTAHTKEQSDDNPSVQLWQNTHYKIHLVEHLKRHNGNKPDKCDICELAFIAKKKHKDSSTHAQQ